MRWYRNSQTRNSNRWQTELPTHEFYQIVNQTLYEIEKSLVRVYVCVCVLLLFGGRGAPNISNGFKGAKGVLKIFLTKKASYFIFVSTSSD